MINSVTLIEPLNSDLTEPEFIFASVFSTLNVPSGLTDAVTEPLINLDS